MSGSTKNQQPLVIGKKKNWKVLEMFPIIRIDESNAYYDFRSHLTFPKRSFILIMAFIQSKKAAGKPNLFCQVWFDGIADPIFS